MKKIALSSLIAVFAVSGAHAANVIDGNPLYMPKANHFYSVSDLHSHSGDAIKSWTLNEEFGYGITDRLTVAVSTDVNNETFFNEWSWGTTSFDVAFRALNMGGWKADVLGGYTINEMWPNHRPFLDEDDTGYTWTAGIRGGYVGSNWTVAAKALFGYTGLESFDWDEEGVHTWTLGLDGQYALCDKLNLVAGVEYTGVTDDGAKNEGVWSGMIGANYNIDATKFIGLYMNADMDHKGGDAADEWHINNGFGFGAKFGIDF
ncbi:MAG: hypothetical protein IJS34_00910 [Alphaproteobacteria bacterium]|nr:hypothetical protein [Alphaproteobacteria bacterium]